jgi:mycothiol synthase
VTGVQLRPPSENDVGVVSELMSAAWEEPVAATLVRLIWASPRMNVARDARIAVEPAGGPTGFVQIEQQGEAGEKLWMYVAGEPLVALLDWGEARAQALAREGGRIFSGAVSGNAGLIEALEQRGFSRVRASYRMGIELGHELEPPAWPPGVAMRTFRPGDERVVYEVQQETFRDTWEYERHPYDEWTHWLLDPNFHHPELWLLAVDGEEVAGIALCWPDQTLEGVGWVGILGVRRPWRRRGLGRALLLQSFVEFRRRGSRRVVLGVDAESLTGANTLYESAGMRVVRRFDIYEKPLQP